MPTLVAFIVLLASYVIGGLLLRFIGGKEALGEFAWVPILFVSMVLAYVAANNVTVEKPPKPLDKGAVGPTLCWTFRLTLPLAVLGCAVVFTDFSLQSVLPEGLTVGVISLSLLLALVWQCSVLILASRMGRRWILWLGFMMAVPVIVVVATYLYFLKLSAVRLEG